MKDLRPIKGSFYISRLIAEGEHEHQDFKFAITDARKIARSISAFANNDGGRLLVGVKDNGTVAGVRNEEDIFVVEQAAEMYCRPAQTLVTKAFKVEGGAVVYCVEIARSERRPVEVKESGELWKAYFRVADENIAVPDFMVHSWRRESQEGGMMVSLSGPERTVLESLESGLHLTPADVAKIARVTTSGAFDIIARLHALELTEFVYTPAGFRIAGRTEP